MPRNGDGSSDNGPIEGHEILHGMTGDVCALAVKTSRYSIVDGRTMY